MWDKLKKVGVGALIAGSGAVLTYLAAWVVSADLGIWGPAISAFLSVLINLLRKLTEHWIDTSIEGFQ